MKFYETNKLLSFVLIALSSLSLGLWVSLIVLHLINKRHLDTQSQSYISTLINACSTNFTNIAYGGLPYSIISPQAIPQYGTLLAQNFKNYHTIGSILLYVSGPFQLITLTLSVFLLLKSRVPYKTQWYLAKVQGLKTSIYIFAWLGLISGSIYFGYTLTMYLKLGTQNCTSIELRQYANQYFIIIILAAIMTCFALINYFISIGVKPQPQHLDQNLFKKDEQQSYVPLHQAYSEDKQLKKKIAQELPHIPKINQPKEIQMIQYPPQGFQADYISRPNNQIQSSNQNIHAYNNRTQYGYVQSRFIPPTNNAQVRRANEVLAVSQIEVNIDNKLLPASYANQKNYTQSKLYSPTKSFDYNLPNKVYNSPEQKPSYRIFNRASNGSKQKSIINDLRNKYK